MDRAERQRRQQGEDRCVRCGLTRSQVPGEWNPVPGHGMAGYVRPDDQTAQEGAVVVASEAVGGSARLGCPGDRGDFAPRHVVGVAGDVWEDWLEMVAGLPRGESVTPDAYALADRTLARLARNIGVDDPSGRLRYVVADLFRDFAAQEPLRMTGSTARRPSVLVP